MCGIAGKINFDPGRTIEETDIRNALSVLRHRGPDHCGFYKDRNVLLGANRLNIVDPINGNQPFFNSDNSFGIVFNGEIYNHHILRKRLVSEGHTFKSTSDTEVVLNAFIAYGSRSLQLFNGMFAFAIWDHKKKSLFLARDRIGIKPLCYAFCNKQFIFASEIKGILADPAFPRDTDKEALDLYLSFGYIPPPYTIYKHIRKIRPGHFLTVDGDGISEHIYWDAIPHPIQKPSLPKLKEEFIHLLEDSIRLRTRDRLTKGLFLSGGIDSSAIAALTFKIGSPVDKGYTMSFDYGNRYNEAPYALIVAKSLGLPLKTLHFSKEQLHKILDEFGYQNDEPFSDYAALPTMLLCSHASQNHKVVITGDGCDELFAGYWRHRSELVAKQVDRIPKWFRHCAILPMIKGTMNWRNTPSRYKQLLTNTYWKLHFSLRGDRLRYLLSQSTKFPEAEKLSLGSTDFEASLKTLASYYPTFNQVTSFMSTRLLHDIKTNLPSVMLAKIDRSSMNYGLEARVPFLDHRLVEFSFKVPDHLKIDLFQTKKFVRNSVKSLLPNRIVRRQKHGFSPPLEFWIRNELKERFLDELSPKRIERQNLVNPKLVSQLLNDHLSKKKNYARELFVLWSLQTWKEKYGS